MQARADEWRAAIEAAADEAELARVDSQLFGKQGEVMALLKSVSKLPKEERPTFEERSTSSDPTTRSMPRRTSVSLYSEPPSAISAPFASRLSRESLQCC